MDPDHKIKTRNFLVTVFRTFDVSNDGRLSRAEVDRVLAALGRRWDIADFLVWRKRNSLFTFTSSELHRFRLQGDFPSNVTSWFLTQTLLFCSWGRGAIHKYCKHVSCRSYVTATLSCRVEPATVDGIVERFRGDGDGKKGKGREGIDWLQGDFLK